MRQVDELFQRVWHYFDEICVVGPDAHLLLEMIDSNEEVARIRDYIMVNALVLLHVRNRGVENLLTFCNKPPACHRHFPEARTDPTLRLSDDAVERLLDTLMAAGKLVPGDTRNTVLFAHPLVKDRFLPVDYDRVRHEDVPGEPLKRRVAREVLELHWLGAASDLYESRVLDVPLGSGIPFEMQVMRELVPSAAPSEIVFGLRLPVLERVPVSELLAIRENERASFEAFREALRKAAKERVESSGHADAAKIARDIEEDIIGPSLTEIRRKLAAAQQLLVRKQVMNLGIGSLGTVCGVLGAAPLATALVIGATANAAAAQGKVFEERRDISLSDMYFLWTVEEHSKGRSTKARGGQGQKKRRKK